MINVCESAFQLSGRFELLINLDFVCFSEIFFLKAINTVQMYQAVNSCRGTYSSKIEIDKQVKHTVCTRWSLLAHAYSNFAHSETTF